MTKVVKKLVLKKDVITKISDNVMINLLGGYNMPTMISCGITCHLTCGMTCSDSCAETQCGNNCDTYQC